MNTMRESKAFYKKMIMILLVGIMGIGIVGCGNSDTKEEAPKESKEEETVTQTEDTESLEYLPSEVMSVEETQALTAGTKIEAKDLTKMPDEVTLDNHNLAVKYCYIVTKTYPNGEVETYNSYKSYPSELKKDGTGEVENKGTTYFTQFTGIEIVLILDYSQDEEGNWNKYIKLEDGYHNAGPVLSEEKIKELDAK